MKNYRVSFAGSGKVVSSLVTCIRDKGHRVMQIYSRPGGKGQALAGNIGAEHIGDPVFNEKNDIVIVAVSDRSLGPVLGNLHCDEKTIVAHTAGSSGLDIFPGSIKRKGVFYPLQTFSEGRKTDLVNVPVFIETSDEAAAGMLGDLAISLGALPVRSSAESRKMLHVAAVFVSNFTNYMLTVGEVISRRAGFQPEILGPLIEETISKALDQGPETSQTGPAIRNDYNTIEKHLELLSFSPELQTLYEEMSRSIINYYKKKGE
ncbi:MAG TPA: DUF2520 domain-containing protein [Bacteroidales bacterium]|nr:DUF2520 domain-containing protein [Bacteroidales bacterium]